MKNSTISETSPETFTRIYNPELQHGHATAAIPPIDQFEPEELQTVNWLDREDLCWASGVTFLTPSANPHSCLIVIGGCQKWVCPICGPRKKQKLLSRIRRSHPNAFMTLTVKDQPGETPRECFDRTRRLIPQLFRHFKRQDKAAEYFRVIEQTKRGFPHYHFLLRKDSFWPQAEVSSVWDRLAQSPIVDIRKIGTRTVNYVNKYCLKSHATEITRQRYTASRGFWLKEPNESDFSIEQRSWTNDLDRLRVSIEEETLTPHTATSYWLGEPLEN